jgi:hypothetical protein
MPVADDFGGLQFGGKRGGVHRAGVPSPGRVEIGGDPIGVFARNPRCEHLLDRASRVNEPIYPRPLRRGVETANMIRFGDVVRHNLSLPS